jgi:poly(A) polymerase
VRLVEADWMRLSVAQQKRAASAPWFGHVMTLMKVRDAAVAERVEARVGELAATPGGLWPQPLVTGDDLVRAGMPPGPSFKGILDAVLDAQLEGKVRTVGEAMELAHRLGV